MIGSTTALVGTLTLSTIGEGYASYHLNGIFDEISFYSHALTDDQVTHLYQSIIPAQIPTQQYSLSAARTLITTHNPSYSIHTQIFNGHPSGTQLVEYFVSVGSSNYGVKLENGIWYSVDQSTASVINEFTYSVGDAYTISFDVYEKEPGSTIEQVLKVYLAKDNNTVEVLTTPVGSGLVIPQVLAEEGYLVDSSISGSSNLGTALYAENAATGALTQGAFALKFQRETEIKSAYVGAIFTEYDNNLFGLIEDYWKYRFCPDRDLSMELDQCHELNAVDYYGEKPYIIDFTDFIYNHPQRNWLNLMASGVNWNDRWIETIIKAYYEASDITVDGNTLYYNQYITSLNVNVQIYNPNADEFKLLQIDDLGETTVVLSGSTTSSTIISVNPQEIQYFYLQVAHGTDTSKLGVSFTPTSTTYQYAYFERASGDSGGTVIKSTYTGVPGGLPVSKSSVSYVNYQMDELGNPSEPTFDQLTWDSTNQQYWLHKMVAMGGLPQIGGSTGIGDPISGMTYGKVPGGGERIINGTTYWETTGTYTQHEYSAENADASDYFYLSSSNAEMLSFGIQSRFNQEMTMKIQVYYISQVAVYYNGEEAMSSSKTCGSGICTYTLEFYAGTDVMSFLIKNYDATWIKIWLLDSDLTPFTGRAGYYSLIDSVEEFLPEPVDSNGYVQSVTYGYGFTNTPDNEKLEAQVPQAARTSMREAAETNPTENRVFDVNLLLEQVVSNFQYFKNNVKSKVYNLLVWEIPVLLWTYKETKLADFVWSLLDEYGFGTIERIINWFDNEQRKEDLAQLILEDADLSEAFNYNDVSAGDLDYYAVAKAGILLFADYIHDQYISSKSWADTTWKWLMGRISGFNSSSTLVDIVASIWSLASATITKVKSVATEVWNGVKAVGQFIADFIVMLILDLIADIIVNIIHATGKLLEVAVPEFSISYPSDGVVFNGDDIKIYRNQKSLNLKLGEFEISLGNILGWAGKQLETLSASDVTITLNTIAKTSVTVTSVLFSKNEADLRIAAALLGSIISVPIIGWVDSILLDNNLIPNEEQYKSEMKTFHGDAILSHLFSLALWGFEKAISFAILQVGGQIFKNLINRNSDLLYNDRFWGFITSVLTKNDLIAGVIAPMLGFFFLEDGVSKVQATLFGDDKGRGRYNRILYGLQIAEFVFSVFTTEISDDLLDIVLDILFVFIHYLMWNVYNN
ncbi:MAG: hypothetical protein ACXAB7_09580 [Candidatus Kariarchaeaceae archaeon]